MLRPSALVTLSKSPMTHAPAALSCARGRRLLRAGRLIAKIRPRARSRKGKIMLASGALLVLRGPDALRHGGLLAHVGAVLGRSVVPVAGEVIDLRVEVGPHDDVGGTG